MNSDSLVTAVLDAKRQNQTAAARLQEEEEARGIVHSNITRNREVNTRPPSVGGSCNSNHALAVAAFIPPSLDNLSRASTFRPAERAPAQNNVSGTYYNILQGTSGTTNYPALLLRSESNDFCRNRVALAAASEFFRKHHRIRQQKEESSILQLIVGSPSPISYQYIAANRASMAPPNRNTFYRGQINATHARPNNIGELAVIDALGKQQEWRQQLVVANSPTYRQKLAEQDASGKQAIAATVLGTASTTTSMTGKTSSNRVSVHNHTQESLAVGKLGPTKLSHSHSSHSLPSCSLEMQDTAYPDDENALESLGLSCLERRLTKQPYVDASSFQDPTPDVIASIQGASNGITEPFPEKLYRMIQEATSDGNESIMSFFPHGRAFSIRKPAEFVAKIMPKYFKSTRMSSFQRQLNLYGFGRINAGPDIGGYYHELFLRGRPALCIHISRVGVPQEGNHRKRGVRPNQATLDPYFYEMAPIRSVERVEPIERFK